MNSILYMGEHPKTYDVLWHSHEEWELVYCTGGEGSFAFENGSVIAYKTGDTVAIPPRLLHANSSADGFTNIHMRMDTPAFHSKSAFKVSGDPEGRFLFAFSEAKYYYQSDITKRELVLEALGDLIASYIMVGRSNSGFSEPVEQIRYAIMHSYTQPDFALDAAIRELPFHYDYLRKLFKKEVGVTPLEYMTGLRMKKAEEMLSSAWSRDYSVAEVAEMCGYSDPLYFSRVFNKHFGCSPSAFAKRCRQDGDAEKG